jgi:hypothetical protein
VRLTAAAALVGVTAWAAVACGNSAPPSPSASGGAAAPATTAPVGVAGTGGTAAAAASTSECANAPPALVGQDLKLPVGKLTATAEGPVTVCAYAGRYEVIVRSAGTVNGLGNAAYEASYTKTQPVSNTLGALDGDIAIFIISPASLGAETALMTDLLKKV